MTTTMNKATNTARQFTFPNEAYHKVMQALHLEKVNKKSLTQQRVEQVLQKLNMAQYYVHAKQIYDKLVRDMHFK